jgi:hypothetical protein
MKDLFRLLARREFLKSSEKAVARATVLATALTRTG